MNLTLVVHSLHGGGAERVAAALANNWTSRGSSVTVITFEPRDAIDSYPLEPGVAVERLGLASPSANKLVALWMLGKRVRALRRAIRRTKPDAVVAFVSESNVLSILSCLGTGIPVVISEHCHPEYFRIGRDWKLMRRFLYPLASSLVSVSKGVQDWFSWLRIPKHVVYNPTARFEVEPRFGSTGKDRKVLAAAGRLTHQKGFDMLIRSFEPLARQFPDWNLVIYGEGPNRPMLERLVRESHLEGRIGLPGLVDDLSVRLSQSDIFVMPSRFEGFGNVLVEAMNVGLPVVSYDCMSGPSEIIDHEQNGLLVPVNDEQALTEALARLMDDPGMRDRFGRSGFEASRSFAEVPVTDQWDRVVREACGEGKRMRIALTIHSLREGGGGMERSATELANALCERGHAVSILSLEPEGGQSPYKLSDDVKVLRLNLNRPARHKVGAVMEIMRTALGLRRAIRRVGADAVVGIGNQTAISTLMGTCSSKVPVVVAERTHPAMYHIGRGWEPMRRFVYPRAAAVVAQTRHIGQWYLDHLNCKRIEVIPNLVRPCEVSGPKGREEMTLVSLGRLDPIKGFDVLINVFAALADKFPDWNLVIHGEGPDRHRLESIISGHGLGERVSLPGWVESAHESLAGADLFALSSRTEGFPNALCEAMACGLPAVAFDCPSGPADIIRNEVDGLLVPANDAEALKRGLERLMGDDSLRREFGAKAADVVERFSRAAVESSWEGLLQEVSKK